MTLRVIHYADIEATYDDPERIARLAGAIASLREENALLVGAGDNVAPGALALYTDGQQALEFFDTVGPDVDTLATTISTTGRRRYCRWFAGRHKRGCVRTWTPGPSCSATTPESSGGQ